MKCENYWRDCDAEGLLRLALSINETDAWRGYLSVQEHEIFQAVITRGLKYWTLFLDGKLNCRLIEEDSDRSKSPSTASQSQSDQPSPSAPTSVDCLKLAFRVRYMLTDKSLAYMFPQDPLALSNFGDFEFDLEEILEGERHSTAELATSRKPMAAATRPDDDGEDNYDDDESDDQGSGENSEQQNESTDDFAEITISPENTVTLTVHVPRTSKEDETKMTAEVIKRFKQKFHIFEDDWENALKQKKLQESDREVDSEDTQANEENKDGKTSSAHPSFGAANLSLKNLLATIESKRDMLPLTDYELSHLISDVRKNRSKWASEDKIGQEELYEAAEKVVLELRGYTEHSTAFLNKVNKRDAPNYFNIIKHPMDLSTVMRKLKGFQYKSKAEFVDDLMLIWKNCLTYNTDVTHFLRVHAIAMQKKTLSLIPLVPDITIRDRAEVEAEETAAERDGDHDSDNEEPTTSKGKSATAGKRRGGKGIASTTAVDTATQPDESLDEGDTSKKRKIEPALPQEDSEMKENGNAEKKEESVQPDKVENAMDVDTSTLDGDAAQAESTQGERLSDSPHSVSESFDHEVREAENQPTEDLDVESEVWQSVFAKQRSIYLSERGELFKGDKLQPDAAPRRRKGASMARFLEFLQSGNGVSVNKPQRAFFDSLDDDKRDVQFIAEYEVQEGVPLLASAVDPNYADLEERSYDINDVKPASGYLPYENGLYGKMSENLKVMQQIRKICNKISLIRQMQQQMFMHSVQATKYEPLDIKFAEVDEESRLPNRDFLNEEVSLAAMKRSVAHIAMHNGFETAEMPALDSLTEIAADFLVKLGRTLVQEVESSRSSADEQTSEDKLDVSLRENGIDSYVDLLAYIRDDIDRHGKKLIDLHARLRSFLADLLRPGVQEITDDSQFKDNSDQFMTGGFSEEFGDDFFGFKELGLDRELGLLTSSVPFHLLHARLNQHIMNADSAEIDTQQVEEAPEYRPLTRELANQQIGLMREFYNRKFAEFHNPQTLPEGDQLPVKQRNVRPKLPPTGKIGAPKKRPKSMAFLIKVEEQPPQAPTPKKTENKVKSEDMDSQLDEALFGDLMNDD